MATRKTTSRSTSARRTTSRARSTTRRTGTSGTRRRTSSGALYPQRRRSRPGLPTTVGTAIGTLVVTTLLDLSWPLRIALIAVVVVVGLAYVLWRHRAEITASGQGEKAGQPGQGEPAEQPEQPGQPGDVAEPTPDAPTP